MQTVDSIFSKLKEAGISQKELATLLGVSPAVVSAWKTGTLASWWKYLPQFADILGVSLNELVDKDAPSSSEPLPAPNLSLLPKTRKVPLLGVIACGEPILAVENIEDYVSVPDNIDCQFTLLCRGDSMINARIFDGDVVYIRAQEDVDDGEIAAVLIGEEATLKKVRKFPDRVVLEPCKAMYSSLVYEGEQLRELRIIGKAVAFTSVIRI